MAGGVAGCPAGFRSALSAKRRPWLFSQHRPSRRRMRCTAMRVHLLPRGGGTLLVSSQSREASARTDLELPHGFLALPGFADNLEGLEDRQLVEVLLAELRGVVLRQS